MTDETADRPSGNRARACPRSDRSSPTGRDERSRHPGWIDRGVSALNALVGDYLDQRGNDLAIAMAFYHGNKPLALDPDTLRGAAPAATAKIVVLIHGLGCSEASWQFPADRTASYGSLLQEQLGYTPFYLRYNTGLHISKNGRSFADLMERLVTAYPVDVKEITLIGHSMGGLVIRSACHYGDQLDHQWLARVRRAIYLASPHLGAPLEKIGNVVSSMLRVVDEPFVRLARNIINLRSTGVKDLRYANLVDEDWQGHDPDALLQDRRSHVPLQPGMDHYVVAGTLAKDADHLVSLLFGDALVRVKSAAGQAPREGPTPRFPPDNLKLFPGLHHMSLAHDHEVHEQIKTWCEQGAEMSP